MTTSDTNDNVEQGTDSDNHAVLGVDNDERICERCEPALSSIDPDFRSAGMLAAELVFEAAAKGGTPPSEGRLSFGPLRVVHRASTRMSAVSDKCVADAIALIRREACAGLRAADVAARFPCSRRLACIRFRKAAGRTILAEIHAVQLETAKRLLETTDIPLKALSDFCGFEDPNSLRKFFRRETGTTLRAWRAARGRPFPKPRFAIESGVSKPNWKQTPCAFFSKAIPSPTAGAAPAAAAASRPTASDPATPGS